ncbi:Calcium channel YVC1 [Colletotrichum fructicola]|uniref:Ion transporter n=1 Tax=Colletotrichum chrysophilum TaxID=1836956 RepID=A0AAD9AMS3_9PEZI|nr:Calcium channel YVC1 [Colletotrichum siamense]KAF4907850.1 Calcium channel YVC1 [Colletotrichum fructicola]KAI8153970.1 Calcium channel YVC1 [Colletotrichum sp. SAR 10_71]KAI8158065.1 Calcium channel YVC1 [Colletotrichum sp. SAR 10_70]KAI8167191.1 Calcium channel YVC1 [Colletotrichum sp. SAR 10_65]KAI8258749.1 Calcium channel YVC1 [Colletotrichum sp. SAR11_239]KAI8266806.1 Calcium channel YVC1 [Colletotrichum sp. SAR 10_98]KAI8280714.1 Calcium channel YVC1 [Colletotrichum sp. SAR11_57]KA
MPIRVKKKPMPQERDLSPVSMRVDTVYELPDIETNDSFREVVKKISVYITDVIVLPSTFEQLRTTTAGECLRILVDHLNATCTNPAIVNALLALKWHYAADEAESNKGLCEARANACEIVAWRFLTRLSEREAVDYCLYEIPDPKQAETPPPNVDLESNENSPLLSGGSWSGSNSRRASVRPGSSAKRYQLLSSLSRLTMSMHADEDGQEDDDPTGPFTNLNALEIAAVADAKRFLSQHVVQKIVTGIWNGDIIFWDSLSVHAEKKPRFYNAHTTDIFSRLRVPKYLKAWEAFFFLIFLVLYYSVLVQQNTERITHNEIVLYLWLAAFLYDELSEWADAGTIFYATDIWNMFDMIMIGIGIAFAVLRVIGITNQDREITDLAFDVFALEALFMVPRVFSLLSLSPYWGTLIPCLKEMSKDFIKFMVLVVIIYLGFLTTFSLIGQDAYNFSHMTMILTKIFFGSSYVGIEIMEDINPIFGPTLMIIFIILSTFLLMGSLTGMLSNSFSRVITHAKEEYLYVYSVYVLEASTSNRLTHFYPPFNLIALVIFRPLRLFLPSDDKFRQGRILLLKATHLPIVGVIQLYESVRRRVLPDEYAGFKGPRAATGLLKPNTRNALQANRPSSGYRPGRSPYRRNGSHSRPTTRAADIDEADAPSAVEVRITELNEKIDKLTALIEAMQQQSSGSSSPP